MLSENVLRLDFKEFADPVRIKKRRLKDVNRGVEYWRKIDKIADRQWRNHLPTIDGVGSNRKNAALLSEYANRSLPTIRARPTFNEYRTSKPRLAQSTRVIQSEYSNQRASLLNQDSEWSPQKSVKDLYPDELIWSAVESTAVPKVTIRTIKTIPARIPEKLSRIPTKYAPTAEHGEIIYSNTWGSLFSPLDTKTDLTEEDKRPREEPLRFRDSVRHLVKTVPRKSVPMSRVAVKPSVKQIKTLTDHRSGNGIVSIIKPLEPLPDIQTDESVDLGCIGDIKKETTFALLERIDRMFHPLTMKTQSYCSSVEVCASSDLTPLTPTNTPELFQPTEVTRGNVHLHGNTCISHRDGSNKKYRSRGGVPLLQSQPLATISRKMAQTEQGVDLKCQGWIDRWVYGS